MRKFTLLIASLFITIGAMAQSYMFEKITLTEDMLYTNAPCTVTTWHDNFTSYTVLLDDNPNTYLHTEYGNNGASLDGLDHYLRVDLGAGNEISAFKFNYTTRGGDAGYDFPQKFTIAGSNEENGTYTEIGRVESGLPTSAGRSWESTVFTSETAYRYLRFMVTETNTDRKGQGVEHNYWHMGEFGLSKAIPATPCTVVYNYKQNGELIGSVSHSTVIGSEYPDLISAYGVTVNGTKPTGTVTGDAEIDIDVTIGEMPFEYYEDYAAVEEANGWYNLIMHSNWNTGDYTERYRTYLSHNESGSTLAWGTERSLTNPSDAYYWAFVGNPINGFRVVNKATGAEKVLSSNGTTNPLMIATEGMADGYNTTWEIANRKYDVSTEGDFIREGAWFCMKYPGSNNYINANAGNGNVAFWTDNDNGSGILAVKPLTINAEADWATFYTDNYVKMPSNLGAEVYYATEVVNSNYIHLEQITDEVIPAQTGVVVKYAVENNVVYAPEITSKGTTTAVEGNLLKGTTKRTLISKDANKSYYVLGMAAGVGFYNAVNGENKGEFYNGAFKAYLELPASQGTAAFYGFDWEGTTGINEVKGENGNVKAIFDLTGRRVENITAPGIYIVGGRKVLVK